MIELSAEIRRYALAKPFRISGECWTYTDAVIVKASDEGCDGFGEAEGVFYLDETAETIFEEFREFLAHYPRNITREELQDLLPAGGARNAIDCALWDLEAKLTGRSIWDLTGISPRPLVTAFTIGLEAEPEQMGACAREVSTYPVLKIKLNNDRPVERIEAIRAAAPAARLVVDVNQGWDLSQLKDVAPAMARLGVSMIEQPLPRGHDEGLEDYSSPVTLCADESCLHTGELTAAAHRYGMINIKLDKTGGLTEALTLAHAARDAGLGLMVGNMMGSSLAMAPSFVIGQLCDFVDIDGPLLLRRDCANGLKFNNGEVDIPSRQLWG
jgi:L-alanine-DL-glutamate epimerase-like enolase superfamily enzyme